MSGTLLLVTGERGVGKTTLCHRTVALARGSGYTCAGLLTLSVAGGDQREVVDIRSGQTRRLTTTAGAGITQGRYTFDPEVLVWGAQVLARALPCDLLVIDEVGPLEIERQQGWAVALKLLRGNSFRLALVVVRPELLAQVRERLHRPRVVRVTARNRDRLPGQFLAMLRGKR